MLSRSLVGGRFGSLVDGPLHPFGNECSKRGRYSPQRSRFRVPSCRRRGPRRGSPSKDNRRTQAWRSSEIGPCGRCRPDRDECSRTANVQGQCEPPALARLPADRTWPPSRREQPPTPPPHDPTPPDKPTPPHIPH